MSSVLATTTRGHRTGPDVERTQAIVVGAGPAGLAVAACLHKCGVAHVLLEAHERVGDSWRRHYDRLHLHTHKRFSGLPYLPWPANAPDYPSRDEVVAYLEDYAERFALTVRLEETVMAASRTADGWEVRTSSARYRTPHLVLATGLNQVPVVPRWPGSDEATLEVLHSVSYRNGEPYRGRSVLVVGFGNSGGEIAVDLVEHGAKVTMAVRGPVSIVPKRILGRPVEQVAAWLNHLPAPVVGAVTGAVRTLRYGDLERHGLRLARQAPTVQVRERGRISVIDSGTVALIREGQICVRPGVRAFDRDRVLFTDAGSDVFDAVVLATGYRPGYPDVVEGVAPLGPADPPPVLPGLHTCGLRATVGGTFRLIAREAPRVAQAIASDPSP